MAGKHRAPRKRTGRGSFGLAGLLAGLILAMSMPVMAGGATKIDVCHSEGNGSYHLINVSENAFDKHVEHGDASPGEPVPGMGGYQFDADCVPVEIADTLVASGDFDNYYSGSGGGDLVLSFTLYQQWDDSYTGTLSYSFAGNGISWTGTITDACVGANQVTVRGDIDSAVNTANTHGLITIRDNTGSYSARAGHWATAADGDATFTQQCGGTATFPASGTDGSLSIEP